MYAVMMVVCVTHQDAGASTPTAIVQGQLRCILAPRVYTLPLVRAIGRTMVQGKNYGPQITVKRISTRYAVGVIFHYYISLGRIAVLHT